MKRRLGFLLLALVLPQAGLSQTSRPGIQMSGDAQMGLVWSDRGTALAPSERGLRLNSRARLYFQFRGETDGGVRYGVSFDTDRATGRTTGQSVFIGR
ncbi:MAG: porin [Roseinatronobacter sp.]